VTFAFDLCQKTKAKGDGSEGGVTVGKSAEAWLIIIKIISQAK